MVGFAFACGRTHRHCLQKGKLIGAFSPQVTVSAQNLRASFPPLSFVSKPLSSHDIPSSHEDCNNSRRSNEEWLWLGRCLTCESQWNQNPERAHSAALFWRRGKQLAVPHPPAHPHIMEKLSSLFLPLPAIPAIHMFSVFQKLD